jgi:phospholipase C
MKNAILLCAFALIGCAQNRDDVSSATGAQKINHLVVIYLENHSFDNLYGQFSGADGLVQAPASGTMVQVDPTGQPYATLPPVYDSSAKMADARFPSDLPNQPFDITKYVGENQNTPDLVHRYYQEQSQIDRAQDGTAKMDRFAAVSDAKGLVMGYYPSAGLPLAKLAQQYTLFDHFFHSAFGGSFLNHIYLISAQVPVFPNAPSAMLATVDAGGNMLSDGAVTPDGHVVNTAFSVNHPHPGVVEMKTPEQLVPNQTFKTIGDELSDAGVSWAWYSGGWDAAMAGTPDPTFQFHHQPFVYFQNFADGTDAKGQHLKDETDFIAALSTDKMPAVAFVKPLGQNNEHPGYADMVHGEEHVRSLVALIQQSIHWNATAVIITYDEHGGFWDHVAPPRGDAWGPGARVPTILISPYAKKGVDHGSYETASILKFIESRWSLPALSTRDGQAKDLADAFDFTQTP